MSQPIVMPSLGMYTAEGTLVDWLLPNGTRVEQGQPIAEIETEKAIAEIVAPTAGVLDQVATPGTLLKEEGLLGYILFEGEQSPVAECSSTHAPRQFEVAPLTSANNAASQPACGKTTEVFTKASPIARKLAVQCGIDIARIKGTGPGGRVVEQDVLAASQQVKR